MIQESPVFGAIKKGVANRVLQELAKLAEADPAKFAEVWRHFGIVLKEGLYEEPEKRDALFALARFASSTHADGDRSLKDYVAALRPNQTAIYYLLGDDLKRLAASPQLEGFPRAASRCCCCPIRSTPSGSRPRSASTASHSNR